jgi:hypothetical protein
MMVKLLWETAECNPRAEDDLEEKTLAATGTAENQGQSSS